jgi:hypothetical protein
MPNKNSENEKDYIDWRLSDDWKITAQDESKRLKRVYFKWQLKTPKPPRHQTELAKYERSKGRALIILVIALWLLIMWEISTVKKDHRRHRAISPYQTIGQTSKGAHRPI